jgi:peroxiredoxin
MGGMPSLMAVDWSKLPVPDDDGAASHLQGKLLPPQALRTTSGSQIVLADVVGRTVVFAYPMTGHPNLPLPEAWDAIPGARGCTPQACAFRDIHQDLLAAGVDHVFGLSTQDTEYQAEAATRLHLPFALISDSMLLFATALQLPTMRVGSATLLKRFTLIIDDGRITKVFYPIFPPDRNAMDVLCWLKDHQR